jgi:hypothetical protein
VNPVVHNETTKRERMTTNAFNQVGLLIVEGVPRALLRALGITWKVLSPSSASTSATCQKRHAHGPNQPKHGGPVGGSRRTNVRRPVQMDGQTDAGSADQWTDEADGAACGCRGSTQKAPGPGNGLSFNRLPEVITLASFFLKK